MGSCCGCLNGVSSSRRIQQKQEKKQVLVKAGRSSSSDEAIAATEEHPLLAIAQTAGLSDLEKKATGAPEPAPLFSDRTTAGQSDVSRSPEDLEEGSEDKRNSQQDPENRDRWWTTLEAKALFIGHWRYDGTTEYEIGTIGDKLSFSEQHDSGRTVFGTLTPRSSWFQGHLHFTDTSEECGTIRMRYDLTQDVIVSNFRPVGENWWSDDMIGSKGGMRLPMDLQESLEESLEGRHSTASRSIGVSFASRRSGTRSQTRSLNKGTARRKTVKQMGFESLPRRVREKMERSQTRLRARTDSDGRRRAHASDALRGSRLEHEPEREVSPSLSSQVRRTSDAPSTSLTSNFSIDVDDADEELFARMVTHQSTGAGNVNGLCPVIFSNCCPASAGQENRSLTPAPRPSSARAASVH